MAEPKKRLTRPRSKSRQSHDAIHPPLKIFCSNCKTAILPHRVCSNCGFYKGKKILALKEEKDKETKIKQEIKDE